MKLRFQWVCFILICYATSIDDAGALSTYVGNVADTQNTQFTGTANTEFSNEQQYAGGVTVPQDEVHSIDPGQEIPVDWTKPDPGTVDPDNTVDFFDRPSGFGNQFTNDSLKRLLGNKLSVTDDKTHETATCYLPGEYTLSEATRCITQASKCGLKVYEEDANHKDEYRCAAKAGVPFRLNGYEFKYENDCRFGSEDYEAS